MPEGVIPNDAQDRELFTLLSDFYLNPPESSSGTQDQELDLMMV